MVHAVFRVSRRGLLRHNVISSGTAPRQRARRAYGSGPCPHRASADPAHCQERQQFLNVHSDSDGDLLAGGRQATQGVVAQSAVAKEAHPFIPGSTAIEGGFARANGALAAKSLEPESSRMRKSISGNDLQARPAAFPVSGGCARLKAFSTELHN